MKTIGLLGGMSWESTVPYYQQINQLVRERLGGLHSAKIVTLGERVEDRFVVSGAGLGQQPARDKLGAALLAASRV